MSKLKLIIKAALGLPLFYFINCSISYLIVLTILSLTSGYTSDQLSSSPHYIGLGSNLSYILGAILTLLMYKIICEPTNSEIMKMCKFNKILSNKITYIILFSLSSAILVNLISGIVYPLFPNLFKSYEHVSRTLAYSSSTFFGIFTTVIIAPIFEEIFYRGLVFGYLRRDCKLITALILQAFFFAFMHGNLFQGFYAFLLGILLGLLVYYTNSIYSSMIGHIIFNILGSGVLSYLSNYSILINAIVVISIPLAIFTGIKLFRTKKQILVNT
ncbi:CPBP family intramembrane metalloprotease [Clostridium perfringens]|nr:CPBP family intramembrane metalloprotease [Clostridium perfringens]